MWKLKKKVSSLEIFTRFNAWKAENIKQIYRVEKGVSAASQ